MGPKINAALVFLEGGRGSSIITNHEHLFDAVHGTAGTQICVPGPAGEGAASS
jgi:carbamate kinase